MTEKVSEPMRLRIASRASCISSLRSRESVSFICLPCEHEDLALTAVRITQLYLDWCAGWDRSLGDARQKRCSVIAARLGAICGLAYNDLHALLHAGAVDNELLVFSLI